MSQPPHKKLRKGTKSCLECRRRKVKCTYSDSKGLPPCDGCVARETACESQEHVADLGQIREPTRDRVDRLEATVKSLSETVAELQSCQLTLMSSSKSRTPVPACRPEDCAASGYGYFDSVQGDDAGCGGCVEQVEPSHEQTALRDERIMSTIPTNFGETSQDRISAQLLSGVPSRGDLLVLTASSIDWWPIHKALMPEPPIKSRIELIERHGDLSKSSTNPASIATWLLCLAISFLQLPTGFDWSALESIPEPTRFVPRTVKQVEEMLSNDDIAGTLEGIECATVFAQIQKFTGRPRKGWLIVRRAIAFAELLKLSAARSALLQLKQNNKDYIHHAQFQPLKRRYIAWTSLCAIDRLLCLLLGTPSAISDRVITPDIDPSDPNASTKRIVWVASEIHNQIVHRDSLPDETSAFEETQNIIQKCQALARTFPPEWKHVDRWATYNTKTASSVMMQSGHSYLVLRSTLPYLLKPTTPAYEPLSLACLQSCRDILRRYFAVRTRLLNGAFLSRSFEVHAFTASTILLLHGDKSWQDPLGDTALLENAKAAMQKAPNGEGAETLTGRMIECLEGLQRFVEGEAGSPERVRLKVPILGGVDVWRRRGTGEIVVEGLEFGVGGEIGKGKGKGEGSVAEWDFETLDEDWIVREG